MSRGPNVARMSDLERWKARVRCEEFRLAAPRAGIRRDARVLEVGAGKGFQAELLVSEYPRAIITDVADQVAVPAVRCSGRFCVASGTALPFRSGAFGWILSSNVLEHLPDPGALIRECDRVLSPRGGMLHFMPTRLWKALHVLLYPISLGLIALRGLARKRTSETSSENFVDNFDMRSRPANGRLRPGLGRRLLPVVHGANVSHWSEFRRFGKKAWIGLFERQGFAVVDTFTVLFYSPYKFLRGHGLGIRRRLGRVGIGTVRAYVVRRQ